MNNNGGTRTASLGLGLDWDLNQLLQEIRPEEHEQWQADCAKRDCGEIGGMAADDTWDAVPALMDMACYGDDGNDHCKAYHEADDDDGNPDINALDWEEEDANNYNRQQENQLKRSRTGQDDEDGDQRDSIEQQQQQQQQYMGDEQDDGSAAAKKAKRMMSVYDGSSSVVLIGANVPTLPPSLLTPTASIPTRMLPMSRIQQLIRAAMSTPPNPSSIRLDTIVKTPASLKPAGHLYARRIFLSLVFVADSYNKKEEARQIRLDGASKEEHHSPSKAVVNVTFHPKLT